MILRLFLRLFVFWIAFTFIIYIVIFTHRSKIERIDNPFPAHLIPGSVVPPDRFCDWMNYRGEDTIACHDGDIAYTYNREEQVITHVSIFYHKGTIGDLINAWGMPRFIVYQHGGYQLVWDEMQVWTIGSSFSPYLPAYVISMGNLYNHATRWRGFTLYKD